MASKTSLPSSCEYAELVNNGTIKVPLLIRQAVNRFYSDLRKSKKADYPYRFDARLAELPITFIQYLNSNAPRQQGMKVKLELWQKFFLAQLFGWVDKKTNERRFNQAYLSIPKKNGKTTLISWVALYMLVSEAPLGMKGYLSANTENQGLELIDQMKIVARSNPSLSSRLKLNKKDIVYSAIQGDIHLVANNPSALDGKNPDLIVIDEFHEQRDSELYTIFSDGLGSKPNQLMFMITTAGTGLNSFAREHENNLKKILAGKSEADNEFVMMYQPDPGDSEHDEEAWRKVNPSFGVTFTEISFRQHYQRAINSNSPTQMKTFLTKRLNLWTRAYETWFEPEDLDKIFKKLDEKDFYGRPAYLAYDLSVTGDLTGYTITIPKDGKYYNFFRAWIPESTLPERVRVEHRSFQQWVDDGYVFLCTGDRINTKDVLASIGEDAKKFDIKEIEYDAAYGGEQLALDIQKKYQIPCIKASQTLKSDASSDTITERSFMYEKYVAEGKIINDNTPVARWCFENVILRKFPSGAIKPQKLDLNSRDRVDLVITSVMALDAVVRHEYNDEEIDPDYSPFYFGSLPPEKEEGELVEV